MALSGERGRKGGNALYTNIYKHVFHMGAHQTYRHSLEYLRGKVKGERQIMETSGSVNTVEIRMLVECEEFDYETISYPILIYLSTIPMCNSISTCSRWIKS